LRSAALRLLGRIGGDDPKAFTIISDTATKAFANGNYSLATAAGEALVSLGDPRGLAVLEQIGQDASVTPRLKEQVTQYQEQLRKVVAGAGSPGPSHP